MNLKHATALASITAAIVGTLTVARMAAQAPSPDQLVAALKQNLAESQKRLRQYEWIETTAISLKGEVKARKQQRAYYGADGKLTKVPIGEPKPRLSRAVVAVAAAVVEDGVKERVVENKKDEMQDYMERASELIHRYVPPSPELVQQAKDKGNMQVKPQAQGPIRVEFANFIQPSDLLAIEVDPKALLLSALSVATYLDEKEDAVTLAVKFGALSDNTGYTAQTTLEAKAKNIRVVIENSGHRPLAK